MWCSSVHVLSREKTVSQASSSQVGLNGPARRFELIAPATHDHPGLAVGRMIDAFGRSLGRPLHPFAAVVFDAAACLAPLRPNVTTVARSLNCSVRTLEREFVARELPPPLRLVVLARWLALAHRPMPLRPQTRTMAMECGFSSTQDFC